ncbi:MAG: imidazoleglycerol-phosphate dehydratase [Acidobacteriota bacterium]
MKSVGRRIVRETRETRETRVEVGLSLRGGPVAVETGVGFLDHMLETLAHHGGLGLSLRVRGDLHVDAHHSVEDASIALGRVLDEALCERQGLARFGWAYAPLDEALARAVVDLARRSHCTFTCPSLPERIGEFPSEMTGHFFRTLASEGRFTLHLDVLRADNGHHALESAFKALALALRQALVPVAQRVRSTKGTL